MVRIKNMIDQRNRLQERFLKDFKKMGMGQLIDLESLDLKSADQQFLQKTIKIINDHISDPDLNVEELCSMLSLSYRQVYRKINALTGDSPNKFIRSIRINRAAELLRNKVGTISEIAFEVGFNNLSYFSRSFREQFGILPSEYTELNS
jgi:AraC-like DNA-binding protein